MYVEAEVEEGIKCTKLLNRGIPRSLAMSTEPHDCKLIG
jgi:hypothetical protein